MRDLTKYNVPEMLAEIDIQLAAANVLQDQADAIIKKIGEHLGFVRALNRELECRTNGDAVND